MDQQNVTICIIKIADHVGWDDFDIAGDIDICPASKCTYSILKENVCF